MYKVLFYFPKSVKVCLLSFLFTSVALWSNDKEKIINEVSTIIPKIEVPFGSHPTIRGDGGRAYGIYQIHQVMVSDYNRISGQNVSHADVFDPKVAEKVCKAVLKHYARHIESQGYTVTYKHLLFIWNGGGGAWRRVHNPINDPKQRNLMRYYERALPHLISVND